MYSPIQTPSLVTNTRDNIQVKKPALIFFSIGPTYIPLSSTATRRKISLAYIAYKTQHLEMDYHY
jgi:hypothetical protein